MQFKTRPCSSGQSDAGYMPQNGWLGVVAHELAYLKMNTPGRQFVHLFKQSAWRL